jgi:hypothetical protein
MPRSRDVAGGLTLLRRETAIRTEGEQRADDGKACAGPSCLVQRSVSLAGARGIGKVGLLAQQSEHVVPLTFIGEPGELILHSFPPSRR